MSRPIPVSEAGMSFRIGLFADRRFKYLVIAPAVFILLFIGLFPLIYSLIVSFQNISMLDEDTSFHGLLHYRFLFEDLRLWQSLLHTVFAAHCRAAVGTAGRD